MIIAKLEKMEMKQKVMENKRNLEKGIYIANDLTKRVRGIQKMIIEKSGKKEVMGIEQK